MNKKHEPQSQGPVDPLGKALARARNDSVKIRDWVQPSRSGGVGHSAGSRRVARVAKDHNFPEFSIDKEAVRKNQVLLDNLGNDFVVLDRYRVLRTRVLQLMHNKNWRILGISSPAPRAGKTVTAINLALGVARAGDLDVLLVDGDIRNPSVNQYLCMDNQFGFADYLTGNAKLEEVVYQAKQFPNLLVLPGSPGGYQDQHAEILKGPRLKEVFKDELPIANSTIVIVDLPPVLVGDDVLATSEMLDTILMVVDEQSTDTMDLQHSLELLGGIELVGTVLNRSSEKPKEHQGYYYPREDDQNSAPDGEMLSTQDELETEAVDPQDKKELD